MSRNWVGRALVVVAFALSMSTMIHADSLDNVPPIKDAYILQNNPNSTYGGNQSVLLGDVGCASCAAAILLQYDVSAIPTGSTVTNAVLSFHKISTSHSGTMYVNLGRRSAAWTESTVTWNNSGILSDAQLGSPTVNTNLTYPSFTNSGLQTLVQEWVNTPSSNRGLSLSPFLMDNTTISFYSKENASGNPIRLSISYTAPACSYTVSPTTVNAIVAGQTTNISVTPSSSSCTWTASTGTSWIHLNPTSGTGNGTVAMTVDPNPTGAVRTGSATIAGQPVNVTQSYCTVSYSPTSNSMGAGGGTGSIAVTAPSGCPWTATSDSPSWLTITSGSSGTSSGTITYSVAANAGGARTGHISSPGATLTLNQDSAAPPPCTSFSISPSEASPTYQAGSQAVIITGNPAGCAGGGWSASGDGSWITVSPTSGSGSGSTTVSWTQNPSTFPRTGTASVAGNTFPITQDGSSAEPEVTLSNEGTQSVLVGDVDGDGLADVVASHAGSKTLEVYRRNGSSLELSCTLSFQQGGDGRWPTSLALGDPDGDGATELIVGTSYSTNGGYVHVGRLSACTFTEEWRSGLIDSFRYGTELAAGDGDGDGWREIAVGVSYDGRNLQVYEFNGTTYQLSWQDAIGSDTDSVQFGDLDGDGVDELAVGTACWSDFRSRVYDGSSLTYSTPSAGITRVAIGDVDGDGTNEVVSGVGTTCGGSSSPQPVFQVSKYNGSTGGYSTPFTSPALASSSDTLVWLDTGQLIPGGPEEIVVGLQSPSGGRVMAYRRVGSTWQQGWQWLPAVATHSVHQLAVGDVDGNGVAEIVVAGTAWLKVLRTDWIFADGFE